MDFPARDLSARTPVGAAAVSSLVGGEVVDLRYPTIPLRWSHQLRRLRAEARRQAPGYRGRLLVLHGTRDGTASPEGAFELARWCPNARSTVRLFQGADHLLTLGPQVGEVSEEVAAFLQGRLAAEAVSSPGHAHSA